LFRPEKEQCTTGKKEKKKKKKKSLRVVKREGEQSRPYEKPVTAVGRVVSKKKGGEKSGLEGEGPGVSTFSALFGITTKEKETLSDSFRGGRLKKDLTHYGGAEPSF